MLILVTGKTGAGKTTYCNQYKEMNTAKIYSIDSWMKSLYWQDMPNEPDMKWFVENQKWYTDRINRCEELIYSEIKELFESDIHILLDLGFTSSEHRMRYINLAKEHNLKAEIHFLNVDNNERWQRVQNRNNNKTDTYTMQVTQEMFDYIESIFEDFSEDETKYLKKI